MSELFSTTNLFDNLLLTHDTTVGTELFGFGKKKLYTYSLQQLSTLPEGYPFSVTKDNIDINKYSELQKYKVLFDSSKKCMISILNDEFKLNVNELKDNTISVNKQIFNKLKQSVFLYELALNKEDVSTVHGENKYHTDSILLKKIDSTEFKLSKLTGIEIAHELGYKVIESNPQLEQLKKQAIAFAKSTVKQILNNYPTVKKGVWELSSDDLDKFLSGTSNNCALFQYSLQKMSSSARSDSEKLNTEISKCIKEINNILTSKFDKFSIDNDGSDWDDGFISIYYTNKGQESFVGCTESFLFQDPAEQPPMQPKQLIGLEPTGYCPVFVEKTSAGHKFTAYIRGPIQDMHHYIMLLEALNTAVEGDVIEIYIDSAGGMVTTGSSISSAIVTCKGKVITIACGLCASAASLVWSAGHENRIWDYAIFMYHMSSHSDMGNTARIAKRASEMVIYVKSCLLTEAVKKGHITQEELDNLCDTFEDKWITAEEMKTRIGVAQ